MALREALRYRVAANLGFHIPRRVFRHRGGVFGMNPDRGFALFEIQ